MPAHAFLSRHLPDAINLTIEELDGGSPDFPDNSGLVVVYSTNSHCDRAPALAAALRDRGLSDVRMYREGTEGWVAAGLPIASGE